MGDNLKLSKDKRHRSSGSIAAPILEGTHSERKLDIRGSILEVDDQFAIAESRCDDLQEKIDIVKTLKRKRKLRKRSATRMTEVPPLEEVPYISVRTLPKKKTVQQTARRRYIETPANPIRGYLDPAKVEQHNMIGQMRGFSDIYEIPRTFANPAKAQAKNMNRKNRADGDRPGMLGRSTRTEMVAEVACGDDDVPKIVSKQMLNDAFRSTTVKPQMKNQNQVKPQIRRWHVPRVASLKGNFDSPTPPWRASNTGQNNRRWQSNVTKQPESLTSQQPSGDRPVVELFHKNRSVHSVDLTRCNSRDQDNFVDESANENDKEWRCSRRHVKYRCRRYEQPTVASQMKQAMSAAVPRFYNSSNCTAIPFIVSKSTAPSHNIGVNIQQVLNGFKNQQPLSCIPLTIAHHMGLGHIEPYERKNLHPSLNNREINAIRLGQRLVRLPSYKYVSYNRLLNLYRESDGIVSRFLRSIDRPHNFYTSMYNLATRDEQEVHTTASKIREKNLENKQRLTEYAALYQEYEQLEQRLREGYDPELERCKEELTRQLAMREEQIRKVVQDYRTKTEVEGLRASASIAEDTYRLSTIKLT